MTFNQIIDADKPVLVDFTASWCGPCKMMAPILKDVKQEMGEAVKIVKIDADQNPGTAKEYQIQGVPTLILFKDGKPMWRQSGVVPKSGLVSVIKKFVV